MNSLILKIELLPTVDFLSTLQDIRAVHGIDIEEEIRQIVKFETATNLYSFCYWEVLLNNKNVNKRGLYT